MRMSQRSYWVAVAVVFVAALALRVGMTVSFVGLSSPPDFEANPDQVDYEVYAHRLSVGLGYTELSGQPTARRAPGTSLTLLPAYWLAGHSYAAGRLWLCVISAATCVAVGWVARQCFGVTAGLIAAVWLAVYPGHFYFAMHFLSETPYVFWLALGLGFSVRSVRGGGAWAGVVAGACWGMAVLTRPQVLLVVPLGFLAAALSKADVRQRNWLKVAVQAGVIAVVLSPWVVRNAVVLGKPTVATIGGVTFWGGNNELVLNDPAMRGGWVKHSRLSKELKALPGGELARDAAAWRYGIEFVRGHAGQMPGLVAAKLYRFFWPVAETSNVAVRWAFALGWLSMAPWLVVGLVSGWRRERNMTVVLLLPVLATLATVVIFYGTDRFRDSCVPALIPLASLGLVRVLRGIFPAWVPGGSEETCSLPVAARGSARAA